MDNDNTKTDERNKSERLLSHEEFLQQYVLNRAKAHIGGLQSSCVEQAEACYKRIRELSESVK